MKKFMMVVFAVMMTVGLFFFEGTNVAFAREAEGVTVENTKNEVTAKDLENVVKVYAESFGCTNVEVRVTGPVVKGYYVMSISGVDPEGEVMYSTDIIHETELAKDFWIFAFAYTFHIN